MPRSSIGGNPRAAPSFETTIKDSLVVYGRTLPRTRTSDHRSRPHPRQPIQPTCWLAGLVRALPGSRYPSKKADFRASGDRPRNWPVGASRGQRVQIGRRWRLFLGCFGAVAACRSRKRRRRRPERPRHRPEAGSSSPRFDPSRRPTTASSRPARSRPPMS